MKTNEERIERVVRVLMHNPYEYTLMIQLHNSAEIVLQVLELEVPPRFFADVPAGKSMWVNLKNVDRALSSQTTADIHIHSVEDIGGAGWSHPVGRGGMEKGQTQVVG